MIEDIARPGITPDERKRQALEALAGCRCHRPYKHLHPETNKKVCTRIKEGWENGGSRYRMCLKKKRYPNEGEATKMANRIMHGKRGTPLRAYFCGFCNGWHLTKRMTDLGERIGGNKKFVRPQ